MDAVYGDIVRFKEAIAHMLAKGVVPTETWRDLTGPLHSRAFAVAGASKISLLNDLHNAVTDSIKNGGTITDFRRDFDAIVQRHGWSYNGKRGWRTRVIYNTNRNTSRAAGRYQQQQRNKAVRPYLVYLTAGDIRVREKHRKWHGIALPVDHIFWETHYPPNGWLCRCKVVSASGNDLAAKGYRVIADDDVAEMQRIIEEADAETGEISTRRAGIDVGWDHNPGISWTGADRALGKAIAEAPVLARTQLIAIANAQLQAMPAIKNGSILAVGHIDAQDVSTLVLTKNDSHALSERLITAIKNGVVTHVGERIIVNHQQVRVTLVRDSDALLIQEVSYG